MTVITLDIPEERLNLLSQRAKVLGITPEDLIRLSIAELLMRPAPEVQEAIDDIVQKHADLYRRLA
ncbi:DNA-binding protein [Chloroflexales bacterium ZM16-3]|nr:DNA-binding protein [Chloroflexales bacterium ZM16-3]